MQPVKIVIHGDFIDCQIYRGRLYLWTLSGELKVYDWDDLAGSFVKNEIDRIAFNLCFIDGNYLYKSELVDLFKDGEFKNVLLKKFQRVTSRNYQISLNEADKYLFGEQDTPGNSIPTDTEIYSNTLYYINDAGFFRSGAHKPRGTNPVSSRPKKLWDCNLLTIKANKYPQIALSGGSEGLFEFNFSSSIGFKLNEIEKGTGIYPISKSHSSFSNYSYLHIYNSSHLNNSFMAFFSWHEREKKKKADSTIPSTFESFRGKTASDYVREFEGIVNEQEIFSKRFDGEKKLIKKEHISWGIEDKIYRATDAGFEIVRFNKRANIEEGEDRFTPIRNMNLHPWKGKVISGGTAYFGTIVECENALVVMLSDNSVHTIPGPITRWRVYPRSRNYENHLHVILDDRIEIYSFNQDYFLQQDQKIYGIEYMYSLHNQVSAFSATRR